MGPASAYAAVLRSIDHDVAKLQASNPEICTFESSLDGIVDIRDFQTTGVVAFARGCPLYGLPARTSWGHRVTVHDDYRLKAVAALDNLTAKL